MLVKRILPASPEIGSKIGSIPRLLADPLRRYASRMVDKIPVPQRSEVIHQSLYAWEAAVKLCREGAEERRQEAFNLQREAESLRRHGHADQVPDAWVAVTDYG